MTFRRFLIVDDHKDGRESLCTLLFLVGHHADAAADGVAALECLTSSEYDVVVSDINMPRLNGFGLFREIRSSEAHRHLPIILMSGNPNEEEAAIALGHDAVGFLMKPLALEALEAAVEHLLH